IERCPSATFDGLDLQLRQNDYHLFHFVGHGTFAPMQDDGQRVGQLLFERSDGSGEPIDAQRLCWTLKNHTNLRAIVLNSCDGARSEPANALAGAGQRLVQSGIPAVVAMQSSITDVAATAFAGEFYRA